MSGAVLHQLVHGYEHGHSLLAASVQLERDDLDLIGRLSDLSGALGPDVQIEPYLSLYPLPSQKFFVVARTWLDELAPRSGCVLTHSILVPLEIWDIDGSPNRFAESLRLPARDTLTSYRQPITTIPTASQSVTMNEPCGSTFIQRYFGEGLTPIVWFGATDAEATAWSVIRELWPSLRARFACCTLALQPRTLNDRPFDLVFASVSVFSRFSEFARDHIVDRKNLPNTSLVEHWVPSWSNCFSEVHATPVCERIYHLSLNLEPYPTAIRRVMLFCELQYRASNSPTAALGALDVLESLALPNAQAEEEQCTLATAALRAIEMFPGGDGLEVLYLLCQRLQRLTLMSGHDLQKQLRSLVQQFIRTDPERSLMTAHSLTVRHADGATPLFLLGISDALMGILNSGHPVPFLMDQLQLIEQVIPYRPEVAATFLKVSNAIDRDRVLSTIVNWSRGQTNDIRKVLRHSLLVMVVSPTDAPFVEELLRDLEQDDVTAVCAIVEETEAFQQQPLSTLVGSLVGERFPITVQQWSRDHFWQSRQMAMILACSYSPNVEGLREIQAVESSKRAQGSFVLTAFIDRLTQYSPPDWLVSILETDVQIWELLLKDMKGSAVGDVVMKLSRSLKRSAISRALDSEEVLGIVNCLGIDIIREHASRQLVADYLEGSMNRTTLDRWFREPWVVDEFSRIGANTVCGVFTEHLRNNLKSWSLTWEFVASLPRIVCVSNPDLVHEVISILLVNSEPKEWTSETALNWKAMLRNVSGGEDLRIDLCVQALNFSLAHNRLPLGAVVSETFYPVHSVAMENRSQTRPWFSWGFGNWDKAKDLRRSLVDSFLQSDWDPAFFALSAREPWLLRKLCKRMMRQWSGSMYLEKAYLGIKTFSSIKDRELADVLFQILKDPDFPEEWD